MTLDEGKAKFIQSWGTLGSKWGINRTMAQIHALLLISHNSLSADEIMEALNISRGNANMNIRALIDWRLVMKQLRPGERKEYFVADKDMWRVAQKIIAQRKKRELEPIREILVELHKVDGKGEDVEAFKSTIKDLDEFAATADNLLEKLTKAEKNWVLESLIKMVQ